LFSLSSVCPTYSCSGQGGCFSQTPQFPQGAFGGALVPLVLRQAFLKVFLEEHLFHLARLQAFLFQQEHLKTLLHFQQLIKVFFLSLLGTDLLVVFFSGRKKTSTVPAPASAVGSPPSISPKMDTDVCSFSLSLDI
jgi:hypothetical protein